MRVLAGVVTCVACVAGSAAGQTGHDSAFYCNLGTLTRAERDRKAEVSATLAARIGGVTELADGYEFTFPGDRSTVHLVSEWVDTERLCCPFFDFTLQMRREGGQLALRLTGREGTKDFIAADFTRWLSAARPLR